MTSFSIVVNTFNRGPLLQKTLESFRWLKYDGEFEVIVVNGPSTDNSDEIIASWLPHIRAGKCDVANLSVSRNIGICMACGDIVVFIDDDAIPEPEWLTQLAKAYEDPMVGAAGGLVFDQTGYSYQYEYSTANRLANTNCAARRSMEHFCFPGSFEFPYLQGTNASFRRSALLEIGGFDEEFEYYLDETELCCRLIDAGYVIRQLSSAYVHHKFAPSHIRDDHRITRYRYPVIKNKIYFSLKHGRDHLGLADIFEDNRKFSEMQARDVKFHIDGGRLSPEELNKFEEENRRAWDVGASRGLERKYDLITQDKLKRWEGSFVAFPALKPQDPLRIILLSRDFPPNHSGGIATFSKDLAEAIAAQGHIVHLVTQSPDINRVDFEQGVWVHRMVTRDIERTSQAVERKVPQHIWNWSATALEEVKRIATHRHIDIVEAPIWDCEGIAFLLDRRWPLVTSLQTTLHFWLDSHSEHRNDLGWMDSFGAPLLALEKELMTKSDAVRSISVAIRHEIEYAYGFTFDENRIVIAPLGLENISMANVPERNLSSTITVLFVGRLEHRKGIDVLLQAIPQILEVEPNIHFRIIGDTTLPGPDGRTYQEAFVASESGQRCAKAVTFAGKVNNETLHAAYASCDIFVAPSRFESFGLVFLEAMREGKPVIGCLAGGMPEVVSQNENGLLVEPGNVEALAQTILQLIQSPAIRQAMGQKGREIFQDRFMATKMAQASTMIYRIAANIFKQGVS